LNPKASRAAEAPATTLYADQPNHNRADLANAGFRGMFRCLPARITGPAGAVTARQPADSAEGMNLLTAKEFSRANAPIPHSYPQIC
jgi:hypothetical protein